MSGLPQRLMRMRVQLTRLTLIQGLFGKRIYRALSQMRFSNALVWREEPWTLSSAAHPARASLQREHAIGQIRETYYCVTL